MRRSNFPKTSQSLIINVKLLFKKYRSCFFGVRVVLKIKSIIMKKLSIAIVLVGLSVSFAKAQTTDTKSKVKTEAAVVAEVKADTTVVNPAAEATKVETMKMEEAEVKKEMPADTKQKARMEKKEAKKLVE
ncbi:hypothetical protein OA86_06345 [Kaistella jeonii]|uniref:Uncharacterized protein n=2 Tax=Kaistella jeonii TaxID=266749 RepID=A0A0C1FEI4_9FLAO|nr:hypothetical protein OA86_06345 [Kaistella jeonii]